MNKKSVRGRLTLAELEQKIASGEVETVITAFTDISPWVVLAKRPKWPRLPYS